MRIILKNLDSNITESDVKGMLNAYAEITISHVKSVVDKGNGRIMTYAYLVTDDRKAGEALISTFHNREVAARVLSVKEVK